MVRFRPLRIVVRPLAVLRGFAFGRADLTREHLASIDRIAAHVAARDPTRPVQAILLVGHTDVVGSAAHNRQLGQRRALAVRHALHAALERQRPGITGRITVVAQSMGESRPEVVARSPEDNARNRRVEVFLTHRPPSAVRPPGPPSAPPRPAAPGAGPTPPPAAAAQTSPASPANSAAAKPDIVSVRGIQVARQIAPQIEALLAAAQADGIRLGGGGYRSPDQQIQLRMKHCGPSHYDIYEKPSSQCTPPTARPGRSNHERGLAIDFTHDGKTIKSNDDPGFQWLAQNAARFGLKNLASEPWHWSVDGR